MFDPNHTVRLRGAECAAFCEDGEFFVTASDYDQLLDAYRGMKLIADIGIQRLKSAGIFYDPTNT